VELEKEARKIGSVAREFHLLETPGENLAANVA